MMTEECADDADVHFPLYPVCLKDVESTLLVGFLACSHIVYIVSSLLYNSMVQGSVIKTKTKYIVFNYVASLFQIVFAVFQCLDVFGASLHFIPSVIFLAYALVFSLSDFLNPQASYANWFS